MLVTRIARAPSSHSSSMTRLVSALPHHRPDRRPAGGLQRAHRRPLDARGDRGRLRQDVVGAVVVEHHVLPGDQHPAQPAPQLGHGGDLLGALPADQDRLAGQDRRADDVQPGCAQRRPGLDDVAHRVGHPEPAGGLHRTVELDHRRLDPGLLEVALQQHRIGGGDPLAGQLLDPLDARLHGGGEPERRLPEPQRHHLDGGAALAVIGRRLQQHVPAGDADVERPRRDVDGDVPRPQVEELGVVVRVVDREVLGAAALAVAALGEHLGRGLAQDALVGHGDAQHGTSSSSAGWGRCRSEWGGLGGRRAQRDQR